MISIIILIIVVEGFYKPRLDYTRNNQLLLWYGNRRLKRKFIILIDNN